MVVAALESLSFRLSGVAWNSGDARRVSACVIAVTVTACCMKTKTMQHGKGERLMLMRFLFFQLRPFNFPPLSRTQNHVTFHCPKGIMSSSQSPAYLIMLILLLPYCIEKGKQSLCCHRSVSSFYSKASFPLFPIMSPLLKLLLFFMPHSAMTGHYFKRITFQKKVFRWEVSQIEMELQSISFVFIQEYNNVYKLSV